MRRRAIIGAAITAAALAGCSTDSPSSSSPSASGQASTSPSAASGAGGSVADRYGEAPALLAQCGISNGTIKPPTGQPWYRDGKVLPLSGSAAAGQHDAELSSWWDSSKESHIGGRTLSDWSEWAASNDRLPTAVCGSGASASSLAAQIYPGQSNPWR